MTLHDLVKKLQLLDAYSDRQGYIDEVVVCLDNQELASIQDIRFVIERNKYVIFLE